MSSNPNHLTTRRAVLIGLAFFTGCGFTPVYAPGGAGDILQNTVRVTAPDTVAGFVLRRRLNDRLGRVTTQRFNLVTTIDSAQSPATVTIDGDTTRFNIIGTATWELTEAATGQVFDGNVETFASYSATGSTVATQTARADAEERLSNSLADLILARLFIAVDQL